MSATKESLRVEMESTVRYRGKTIAAWSEKFAADPAYQLAWSTDVFTAAAELAMAKDVLAALDDPERDVTVEKVREHARRQAMRGARWPERSTSPASNLMAQCMTAAWAELAEKLS